MVITMFCNRMCIGIGLRLHKKLFWPNLMLAHSKTCPTQKGLVDRCPGASKSKPTCASTGSGSGKVQIPQLKRAAATAKTRLGFLPDDWFVFFYPHTGVSGPYVFGIGLINYLLSKEIYVMEHEYYLGLSIALVIYLVTTKFGPSIGKSLDAEVDAIQAEWEKGREIEKQVYEETIKMAESAQKRARGQKLLMAAKKENIAMQLEAAYRERMMHVYRTTKGRLEYHSKRFRAENKAHHKWMIMWILENVRKSITPEFEKEALQAAIRDLSAAAAKA